MAKKETSKVQKAKQKIVDDKTFGLKNKNKSSKVQKYVQQVQISAEQSVNSKKNANAQSTAKKELEQKKKEELAELFKPVAIVQKIPFGVDPKTIVCQYFKIGACTKGKNCKFSHDLEADRKTAKIDLYTDARETLDKENDTMDKWDQEKLESVVASKHGKGNPTTTDIVCKFFLQAVEEKKYGWFWQCPNGSTCKYRHALPPGFVLKENKVKSDEAVQTLEEWIEEQRTNLPEKLTPVTLDSFKKWKQDRVARREKEEREALKARESAVKAGKTIGASGRDLFTYNPDMFNVDHGDDDEAMEIDYTQREEDEDEAGKQDKTAEVIDEALFEGEELEGLEIDDDDE